jgi:hypothetical protein
MTPTSLQEKRKSRIGPKDFKRNFRAKRDGDRAIGFVFVSMLASVAFMISFL